jgi:hypothetical protein
MLKTSVTKFLSILTSASLVIPSFIGSAGAIGAPAAMPGFVKALTPPESLGYVASSFDAGGAKKPRLVIVADLHAHVEVQRNIMGILDTLVPAIRGTSEKKVPVFLEGGWTAGLEEPLRGFSHPNVRHFMDEYYLYKAELSGPQAYSEKIAGSNQVSMIGVEDKEEYLANKAVFAKSYPARKQVLEDIKFQEAALGLLQDSVEGRSYRKLQDMRTKYNDGQLSAEKFAKTLVRLAHRFNLQNRYVEVLMNMPSSDPAQVEIAFAQVYRDVSGQLANNRPWTSYLRTKLPNEDAVRANLSKVTADLDLLKRLISNQLTPAEVTLAMSRIADLEQTANLILKDQPVTISAHEVILQSLEFYPLAFLRDEILAKNSLKSLEKFGADATGILVAGGFHTDAITQYLKDRQIPYLLIHPNVTREITTVEQLNYVKRMGGEHVTMSELKSDLDAIQSGRVAQGAKSSVSFIGVEQVQAQPNSPATKDTPDTTEKFFDGYQSVQDLLKSDDVEKYTQGVREMEKLGLDIHNADKLVLTFQLGADGKTYQMEGQEGPSIFASLLNARLAAAPGAARPKTMRLEVNPDKWMMLETGGEADYSSTANGNTGIMRIAGSRFRAVEALQTIKPAAGSVQEANAIRGITAIAHENEHTGKWSEADTTAMGLAHAGKAVATHLGDDAVGRMAAAILPQIAVGDATKSLVTTKSGVTTLKQKFADIFTPKAFKVKTVQEISVELAKEIPGSSPDQVAQMLNSMGNTLEVRVAMFGGPTSGLRKKIANAWANMRKAGTFA